MARNRKIGNCYYVYERLTPGSRKETCFKAGSNYRTMLKVKLRVENMKAKSENNLVNFDATLWDCCDTYYDLPRKRMASSKRNIQQATVNLKEHFDQRRRIADVTEQNIEEFLKWMQKKEYTNSNVPGLKKKYKRNGIIRKMRTVRAIFKMAIDHKIIDKNPTIEPIKNFGSPDAVARFLKDDEVTRLIFHVSHQLRRGGPTRFLKTQRPLKYGPKETKYLEWAVMIALHTGLRAGEVLNLKKEDVVELEDGPYIEITKRIEMNPTKRRDDYTIPLPDEILYIFEALKNGPLFPTWDVKYLDQCFRRAAINAGLYPLRFHDLRHTFAKNYLQKVPRATIGSLAKILGHSDTSVTYKWYGKFERSFLREQMNVVKYRIESVQPKLLVI